MRDKYGRNHVAKIGTYTTMSSRMALKDAGRVLGFEASYMNYLSKQIPNMGGNNMPIEEAIEEVPEIKQANKQHPELFQLAADIQGTPRSSSQHASGVIIAPQELDVSLPLYVAKGEVVTQYDGETLEDIGYIKVPNSKLVISEEPYVLFLSGIWQFRGTISSAVTTGEIPAGAAGIPTSLR